MAARWAVGSRAETDDAVANGCRSHASSFQMVNFVKFFTLSKAK